MLTFPIRVRFRNQGSTPEYLNFGDSKIGTVSCQVIRYPHPTVSCQGICFQQRWNHLCLLEKESCPNQKRVIKVDLYVNSSTDSHRNHLYGEALMLPLQARFRKQGSSHKYLNFGDSKTGTISFQGIGLDSRIRDPHPTIYCHGICSRMGGIISVCWKMIPVQTNKQTKAQLKFWSWFP